MANMNVKRRLETIAADLALVREHVALYSGIDKDQALYIDTLTSTIAQEAAFIASEARTAAGNRSGAGLVTRIRKALGFTQP